VKKKLSARRRIASIAAVETDGRTQARRTLRVVELRGGIKKRRQVGAFQKLALSMERHELALLFLR
jgi:hypothetical protein